MCTKNGQHPPGAGSALQRTVIIKNHAAAIPQTERLHPAGKFFGRWQHIVDRIAGIGQFTEVHEDSARNVASFIFGGRVASGIGHEFSRIDDAQIRRTQFVGQPVGRYQQFHIKLLMPAIICTVRPAV